MKEIKFYSWSKDYFEFSNFSLHPIEVDGKIYATNEHYFQSIKFLPTEMIEINREGDEITYREYVRLSKSPKEAKIRGTSRLYKIDNNWDNNRIEVMRKAIKAKFTQHQYLRDLLLSTENATLKEDSPYDNFWGVGKYGNGKNMLGKLLMEFREELQNNKL